MRGRVRVLDVLGDELEHLRVLLHSDQANVDSDRRESAEVCLERSDVRLELLVVEIDV